MLKRVLIFLLRSGVLVFAYLQIQRLFPAISVALGLPLILTSLGMVLVDSILRPVLNVLMLPLQLITLGLAKPLSYGVLLLLLIAGLGLFIETLGLGEMAYMSLPQSLQALAAIWLVTWTLLTATRP